MSKEHFTSLDLMAEALGYLWNDKHVGLAILTLIRGVEYNQAVDSGIGERICGAYGQLPKELKLFKHNVLNRQGKNGHWKVWDVIEMLLG